MLLLSSVCCYLQVMPVQGLCGEWVGKGERAREDERGRGSGGGKPLRGLAPHLLHKHGMLELNLAAEKPA